MGLLGSMIFVALASVVLAEMEYPAINIETANSIPDYLVQYPNSSVVIIKPTESDFNKLFTFGEKETGDVLLTEATNSLHFESPQDVTIQIKYPSPRNMVVISRLEVIIPVASKPVNCYITAFGERNSSLSIWAQSKATNKFEYTVKFYGRKSINHPFTKIQIASKIQDYLTLHPSANVTRMSENKNEDGRTRYYLGHRFGADQVVSSGVAGYTFPIVQDVALSLEYPQINDSGATITYIELLLTENSGDNVTAYVIAGGLQQDYVKIWIQTKNSTIFKYDADIYGYFLE